MRASQSLARLHRDWTRLGEADPLWAVCVDPARHGGRWDVQEFLATGRAEIAGNDRAARRDTAGTGGWRSISSSWIAGKMRTPVARF